MHPRCFDFITILQHLSLLFADIVWNQYYSFSFGGTMLAYLFSVVLLATPVAEAYSPSEPHPHKGKLSPISSKPRAVGLTAADKGKLKTGQVVIKQQTNSSGTGGKGVAIQYIKATPQKIWATILNYPRYKDWVANVKSAKVYKQQGNVKYVELISKVAFVSVGMYTRNSIHQDKGYMTWTLDYSRKSDVDDTVGYWLVEPISTNPPLTKVEYSSQMQVGSLPKMASDYLTKTALISGTKWVKTQSEK